MSIPTALTIAGSDSSGAAGIQADLPTFAALGVHGCSVLTLVTAQNRRGIDAFHELPVSVVEAQLDTLLADRPPAATKTGLLRAPEVLAAVAERAPALGHLVIDPVSTASDGRPIVPDATVAAYRHLAALATVLTPNLWELELLLGVDDRLDADDVVQLVEPIRDLGSDHVVVTGGRGASDTVRDVVIGPDTIEILASPRRAVGHAVRGTGCTFSAAIGAGLASGSSVGAAIATGHAFVQERLELLSAMGFDTGAGIRPGLPHQC